MHFNDIHNLCIPHEALSVLSLTHTHAHTTHIHTHMHTPHTYTHAHTTHTHMHTPHTHTCTHTCTHHTHTHTALICQSFQLCWYWVLLPPRVLFTTPSLRMPPLSSPYRSSGLNTLPSHSIRYWKMCSLMQFNSGMFNLICVSVAVQVLLTPLSPFKLGHKVLNFLLHHFFFCNLSLANFTQGLKVYIMYI